ncbi:hypothetical protein CMV_008764 [Castanea mollissima]|uniref:Gnk2-homologous domain-containing protein n=1 Tax=Castanea mollissima TaxID=60419 RepID=A0A8J4VRJ5_9ROSI|nr:hypothetical protein CMV_008764 [Castanea mollissima]
MVSSRLVFLVSICILVSQAIAQPDFLHHFCLGKGNYTSNSAYNTNLNQVLSSLSSNTEIDYRGDTKPDICRSCLNKATKLLPLRCPNQKEAIGWYDDCMLRYSFRNIYGIMEASRFFYTWDNYTVSANVDQFNLDLRTLLDSQRVQAAAGSSLRKFAAGKATAPNNQTLYSLVQCTPDLSDQDCRECLFGAMGDIPNCCDGKQGGRVIRPSCNLRFEVALFSDPSVSPPASNNTPAAKGKESNKSRTVIIVVPIISFVVLIIISFCIYLRVRKPREKPQKIVSGRKNSSFRNGENIENLLSYAWKNWKQGIVSNLVDPTLKAGSTTEIMRCIHIGLLCVQENVAQRPTMASVVLMLNSYLITLPIPSEPGFFMNNGTESNICLQWEHDSRVT